MEEFKCEICGSVGDADEDIIQCGICDRIVCPQCIVGRTEYNDNTIFVCSHCATESDIQFEALIDYEVTLDGDALLRGVDHNGKITELFL